MEYACGAPLLGEVRIRITDEVAGFVVVDGGVPQLTFHSCSPASSSGQESRRMIVL
jgi:hypothetical protein